MKESIYNVQAEYKNHYLIYNLRNGNCIILDSFEYSKYLDGSLERMEELGFWVSDDINEYEDLLSTYYANNQSSNHRIRSNTILTTTYCNAKCPYCFEQGYEKINMDDTTAYDIAKYILNKQDNCKKLYVIWFGGEPLLNKHAIDIISQFIKSNKPDFVEFRSSIYTNGYLLDDELINHAINEWNLTAVQITLDGLKESYERIKGYTDKNAFEKVIDNINLLAEKEVRVQIRLNYDKNNIEEILELIGYIKDNVKNSNKLFIYGQQIRLDSISDNSKQGSVEYDIRIFEKLYECGFCRDILKSIKRNLNTCLAGAEYSRIYFPNGDINMCSELFTSKIGNIYDGEDVSRKQSWYNNRLSSQCKRCLLLPICGGGCILERIKGKKGCMASREMVEYKLNKYLVSIVDNLD